MALTPASGAGRAPTAEPWLLYEDDDLVAVAKPAGVTTERADDRAQAGMAEWVAARRPDRALRPLHRLDVATSGVLVLGRPGAGARIGASTIELVERSGRGRRRRAVTADGVPSIRATAGSAIAGARRFVHLAEVRVDRPGRAELAVALPPPPSFTAVAAGADPAGPEVAAAAALEGRAVLFDPAHTDAHVWMDRHHDGVPGLRVERLGPLALVVDHRDPAGPLPPGLVEALMSSPGIGAVFHQPRRRGGGSAVPVRVAGRAAPTATVVEDGVRYDVDLEASATSTGLFLDQRDTRYRLRHADRRGTTVLNAFGHTGSLSVAAALAGAETLTLDLSTRYLDRARANLRRNGLDPADHDFIYGDALHWMDRLARKGRTFDVVLVDPPSTSTGRSGSRGGTRWVVERDLHDLVARAARLTAAGGSVFVSTNLRRLRWDPFVDHVRRGLAAAGRSGRPELGTVPLDFRTGPDDPSHLKTAWIDLDG